MKYLAVAMVVLGMSAMGVYCLIIGHETAGAWLIAGGIIIAVLS